MNYGWYNISIKPELVCQIKYYPLQFTEQTFYPSIPSPIGLRSHSLYQLYILIHLPQCPFLPFDKPTWKVEDTLDLIGLFQQKNPSIYLPICRLILLVKTKRDLYRINQYKPRTDANLPYQQCNILPL